MPNLFISDSIYVTFQEKNLIYWKGQDCTLQFAEPISDQSRIALNP